MEEVMSSILVTGGLGFIGHRVVAKLEEQGHYVRTIDNLTDYSGFHSGDEFELIKKYRRSQVRATNHKTSINLILDTVYHGVKPDIVIHLAHPANNQIFTHDFQNSQITSNLGYLKLLTGLSRVGLERFVLVSSSMVYGNFESDRITERHRTNPRGFYAISKNFQEQTLYHINNWRFKQRVIVRPSAVYGAGDVSSRVLGKFLQAAYRNETLEVEGPNEVLDWTYVDDCADGIVRAALAPIEHDSRVFNITRNSDEIYTLLDAAEFACQIAGGGKIQIKSRNREYPRRGRLDNTRARQELGFTPYVDLDIGLDCYFKWLNDTILQSSSSAQRAA